MQTEIFPKIEDDLSTDSQITVNVAASLPHSDCYLLLVLLSSYILPRQIVCFV